MVPVPEFKERPLALMPSMLLPDVADPSTPLMVMVLLVDLMLMVPKAPLR